MNIPAPVKSLLSKFDENIQRAHAELESKQLELERQCAEAVELQKNHAALNRELDHCADRLIHADEQFENFKLELAGLKDNFLDAWGNPSVVGGPNYRHIVMLEAAIADYPRVRQHLVSKVESAKTALSEFEREHL